MSTKKTATFVRVTRDALHNLGEQNHQLKTDLASAHKEIDRLRSVDGRVSDFENRALVEKRRAVCDSILRDLMVARVIAAAYTRSGDNVTTQITVGPPSEREIDALYTRLFTWSGMNQLDELSGKVNGDTGNRATSVDMTAKVSKAFEVPPSVMCRSVAGSGVSTYDEVNPTPGVTRAKARRKAATRRKATKRAK